MSEPPTHPQHIRVESLATLVQELLTDLAQRGQVPELPTGIPLLDDAIWGLHRSELTVIAARPGEGKTTLALQIAAHLAEQHRKVVFVSMEMTRHQLTERLLVQMTQTDAWNMRTGKDLEILTQRLAPLLTAKVFERMNLRIVDRIGYTVDQVQHLINELIEQAGDAPDVLVLDFIQLIRLDAGMQRFEGIAEYLIALKELAMRHNLAVLVCSQVNREGAKGEMPKLEHLKGSGALEELADCVIMCWWQELGNEERPQGYKYWLVVRKNRYGPPGVKIPVRFDTQRLTFHPVEGHVDSWQEDGKPEGTVTV